MAKIYQFGKFTFNVQEQTLTADENVFRLPTKEFEILNLLIQNNGKILTKDEMIAEVWQDTFVEESNLPQYISRLRKILNIDGNEFIKTFSKRGYRFSADVEIFENELKVQRQILLEIGIPNRAGNTEINSLAVLPFQPLSCRKDEKFLGLGIADALITQITRTGQIVVRPTGSIIKYADTRLDPNEIALELGVSKILSGNFQRIGNRLRLSVQLSADKKTLWAENFNSEIADIFEVQDQIAYKIANVLVQKLSVESKASLKKHYTQNIDAYQEYLKGRFYLVKHDAESLKTALHHFETAIEIDPLYALAYAGIADVYLNLPIVDEMSSVIALPKAKAAVLRALEIDSELAEAHTSLGTILLCHEWNWKGAEVSHLKAIELNPKNAVAYQFYGTYLMKLGRNADSVVTLRKAQTLDPLSPTINTWLAECLSHLDETETAITLLRDTVKFSPDYFPAYYHLVWLYTKVGRFADAQKLIKKALKFTPNISFMKSAFVYFYVASGERSKGVEIAESMVNERKSKHINAVNIASCYAILGESEKSLNWLETAFEERDIYLTWIKRDQEFQILYDEPRLTKLLAVFES